MVAQNDKFDGKHIPLYDSKALLFVYGTDDQF